MVASSSREAYVFVSYASADRARVFGIAGILEAQGVPLWLDRRSITGGLRWTTEIVRGVEDCAILLVMCSPASVASRNVQQEVQLAWESGRPMLPVIVEEVRLPPELRYALAGQQWVEVRDRPENEWLPELLNALVSLGMRPPEAPQADSTDITTEPFAGRPSAGLKETRTHNLTAQRDSFVGRADELQQLEQSLLEHRVVTLTGPGGVGKSRLALELAWRVLGTHRDGVWLVPLENATDPAAVVQRVADAVGVRESPGEPLLRQLTGRLARQDCLLVLDNCERMLEPCVELASSLLEAGRAIRIQFTSREITGMRGEQVSLISPMDTPSPGTGLSLAELRGVESVQLFVDRATAVSPGFAVDSRNAGAVAEICRALDGIPLAIELAAARIRTLSPEDLRTRLTDMFDLLRSTDRSAPLRQRTLGATVDWSYDALEEQDQALWRRLSVFAGTFSLSAAERICGFDPVEGHEVLDLLTSLVDKSMVLTVRGGAQVRYRVLRTLRQYAWARLSDESEAETTRDRHAAWCREIVAAGDVAAVNAEYAEIRAALEYLLAAGNRGREALETAGHESLYQVLYDTYPGEGERLLGMILAQAPRSPTLSLGWVLCALGRMRYVRGQFDDSRDLLEQALAIGRQVGGARLVDRTMLGLGTLYGGHGHYDEAIRWLTEAIEHARRHGFNPGNALTNLSGVYIARDDFATARPLLEEALRLGIRTGLPRHNLGMIAFLENDIDEAARLAQDGLAEAKLAKTATRIVQNLALLGWVHLSRGEPEKAVELAGEATGILTQSGASPLSGTLLLICAWAWLQMGRPDRAATMLSACEALRLRPGLSLRPRWGHAALLEQLRAALDPAEFERCWTAGQAMGLEQAIDHALGALELPTGRR